QAKAASKALVARPAKSIGGHVVSTDEQRGTPTFFRAQRGVPLPPALVGASAERIARHHLAEHASLYNLTSAALSTAKVQFIHDTGRGGIIVVFRQSVDGVEVLNSDMKVLTNRQGELVALSGSLHPSATPTVGKKLPKTKYSEPQAVALALKDL